VNLQLGARAEEVKVPRPATVTDLADVFVIGILCFTAKSKSMNVVVLPVSAKAIVVVFGKESNKEMVEAVGYPV
jgi:hypothetical protein